MTICAGDIRCSRTRTDVCINGAIRQVQQLPALPDNRGKRVVLIESGRRIGGMAAGEQDWTIRAYQKSSEQRSTSKHGPWREKFTRVND